MDNMICQIATLLQRGPTVGRSWAAALFATAALSVPALSWADDDANKPPPEIEWQLPAAPAAADMLPFFQNPITKQWFAIDAKSLSVDKDEVVRYTIIGTSRGGAKNISYEGIRCSTFEKRLYAVGQDDGTWTKARDSEWQPIPTSGTNKQQADLATNFLCSGTTIAGTTKQILQNLRYPKVESTGRL
jgi:hypothetical protein